MRTFLLLALFILICLSILVWEQNKLVMMDEKITVLKAEYETIINENDSIKYKINSILALEKLDKIAKEKKFKTPSQNEIVNIYE